MQHFLRSLLSYSALILFLLQFSVSSAYSRPTKLCRTVTLPYKLLANTNCKYSKEDDTTSPGLEYSTATEKDLQEISVLISDNLDGPFAWWAFFQRLYSRWDTEAALQERMSRLVNNRMTRHCMITARLDCNHTIKKIVAFVELGMRPMPMKTVAKLCRIIDTRNSSNGNSNSVSNSVGNSVSNRNDYSNSQDSDEDIDNGDNTTTMLVPHIGNLVVHPDYRRQGIAYRLMHVALDVAANWGDTFVSCSVEPQNEIAYHFYTEKLGFTVVETQRSGNLLKSKESILLVKKL